MAEVQRVLKPGGLLFAAFISRYAVPRYAALHDPTWPHEQKERLEILLATGKLPPRGKNELEFTAHFDHPSEVGPLCQSAGFEVLAVLGVEGLVDRIETEVNTLSGASWKAWVDLNHRLAPDPAIHGCTAHLLVIAA
ncbi:MAG: hypothetical protein GTO15_10965, partial [Pseudomonas stutzeri]|nr:hypothetical protein [Stutzerimonas stutzeri]